MQMRTKSTENYKEISQLQNSFWDEKFHVILIRSPKIYLNSSFITMDIVYSYHNSTWCDIKNHDTGLFQAHKIGGLPSI